MQEPVYVLHLITCHGHIMPRLAELLFPKVLVLRNHFITWFIIAWFGYNIV